MSDIHDELVAETATVGDEVGIAIATSASLWANNDGLEVAAGDDHEAASEAPERTVASTADDNELEELAGAGDDEHEAVVESEERGVLSATAIFADVAAGGSDEDEGEIVAAERSEATTPLLGGESDVGDEDEVAVAVVEVARATQE